MRFAWIDGKNYKAVFRSAKMRDGKLILKIDVPQLSKQMNMFLEFWDVDIHMIEEALASIKSDTSRTEKLDK